MITVESKRARLLLGYTSALAAALCYAATTVLARKIVVDFAPPIAASAFAMLFGTIIMAVFFARSTSMEVTRSPRRALVMACLVGVAATWGLTSLYLAVSQAPVVVVSPIIGAHPLFAIVLAYVFLQRLERVTSRTVLGALLIVGGVAVVAVGST